MEFEQIIKRLDLLEKQQRENKEAVAVLGERLTSLDTSVSALAKQIKAAEKQANELSPLPKRVEQFESALSKLRAELTKTMDEREKNHARAERDSAKAFQAEIADLQKAVGQLKTSSIASITELKKEIKQRGDEIQRMLNTMSDFRTQVDDARRANEDAVGAVKALDEARKNDLKRVADLQGEIASVRKRADENRDRYAVLADGVRSVENRFNELLASELERKQAQQAFIDQQSIAQVDRERAWKEWQAKFEAFQKEAAQLDAQLQSVDEALRNAKKAQETYLELNTRLERRINEVTEMQRLSEERLRQEWITFKTDDQKRWAGYSLSAEESFRDLRKDLQKAEERIPALSDAVQVLQDQMHQITDASEKQLQEMMNVVHEWMTSYQRIMGHGKKPGKK